MRMLPAALAAHLSGDATSMCHCWRVTRRDGVVLGFTEHDHDLRFAGTDFLAASGFEAADSEAASGLSVEAGEVVGGFSNAAISEADVVAGRYDGARVEVFKVNWLASEQHVLLRVQEIGDVVRAGGAFRAELRRLTHRLDQVQGRIYGRRCDAVLGDGWCKVNLDSPAFRGEGAVAVVLGETRMRVTGLDAATEGFYRYGVFRFVSGANAGHASDIEDHRKEDGIVTMSLWLPPPLPLAVGDLFAVTAGCDKSFATCADKFSNRLNFQGFPHMPGTDFAFGYADGDTVHDGRPLYG
ncbi:DUF2163 domain-containing protein [Pararhizobium sp. BT-229]|uniref:DUF2163 domain-containing protein n=1 Tax=Pararhizobium sp. BT-229 TaxID=2986923 RepID=UPI0021F7531F|nr:DUF2163 domain-containing protein [Pararhizobium sp. BT-229]MCV9963466.1 DUF2163 domain-containing protein [Pararhizobium sp. BT-229]